MYKQADNDGSAKSYSVSAEKGQNIKNDGYMEVIQKYKFERRGEIRQWQLRLILFPVSLEPVKLH